METKLTTSVTKIASQSGVKGVAVADRDGVTLMTSGSMKDGANIGSLMMADAKSMFPKGSRNKKSSFPVVTLHASDGSKVVVANKHGETVTLHID